MGQREAAGLRQAGWPSSYNRQQKPTVNHLQEMIRALDQKAVATWRHPQAGRPHMEAPRAGSWRGSKAQLSFLLSTDATCNTGRESTLEGYK